jgi:alkylation response protein AidB-like acyl-CoA dehydrogenase
MRFTESQQQYADAVRALCAELSPAHAMRGGSGDESLHDQQVLQMLADRDLLGVSLPAADGGAGRTFVEECVLLEETSRAGLPVVAYSTALTAAQTYLRWGSEEQRHEIVTTIRGGGLESITFTEPDAGSDLSAVATSARRVADGFVLNGRKRWISFAHLAAHLLVLARTDASGGRHDGLTLLMVPAGTPGVTITPLQTMGPHMVNEVLLDDVGVPASAVVGTEGEAWRHILRGLSVERVIIAAMSVGAAQRALDTLLAHVRSRVQFGRPIGSFQAVRHRIADLATEIAHCRAFVYDVADRIDAGEEAALNREGSMAKLKATEVAKLAALEGVQLMGGYGYGTEWGMEQQLRLAIAPPIYGGANEVQRDIIGKSMGL